MTQRHPDHDASWKDDDFGALAGRVADGSRIDWESEFAAASSAMQRELIRALQAVDELALSARAQSRDAIEPEPLQTWEPFEILGALGRGAYGAVWVARDPMLDRLVALKVYAASDSLDAERDDVLAEGRLLARLRHPNVVTVYGVDQRDAEVGMWMELVRGQTLHDLILESGPLGTLEVAVAGVELCRALAAVHGAGILHRDLKAQNVLREEGGRLVLVDFGLGLDVASAERAEPSGTPLYLAPEILVGRQPPSVRSDLYALGVLLFFLATTRHPVEGCDFAELVDAQRHGRRLALRELRPALDSRLIQVIDRATAADPEGRFASASDLERALLGVVAPGVTPRKPVLRTLVTAAMCAVLALAAAVWTLRDPKVVGRNDAAWSPRKLTTATGWEGEPAISPDGSQVAYVSKGLGSSALWLIESDGGGSKLMLTDGVGQVARPTWFPDGRSLAYSSKQDGRWSIRRVGRLGGPSTLLLTAAKDPAVSPDGRRLAFSRENEQGLWRIGVVDLDALADPTILTTGSDGFESHQEPAWSSDGRWICYRNLGGLWMVASDGSGDARQLSADDAGVEAPTFSPDGESIYFGSRHDRTQAIWRLGIDSQKLTRITVGSSYESHPSISADGSELAYVSNSEQFGITLHRPKHFRFERVHHSGRGNFVTLAPDASSLVFVADSNGQWELLLRPLHDGVPSSAARRLAPMIDQVGISYPSFSPDGRWIVYQRLDGEERDIYMVSVDGGAEIPLLDSAASEISPAWSPDGRELAYVVAGSGDSWAIWRARVGDDRRTHDHERISTELKLPRGLAWSPDGRYLAARAVSDGEVLDAWLVHVDGSAPARRLSNDVGASWLAWDATGRGLWMSGRWDAERLHLRRFDIEDATWGEPVAAVDLGNNPDYAMFAWSRGGDLLVYSYGNRLGDLWLLEADRGVF